MSLLRQTLLALRRHWPEYLMEAAELGLFMLSACVFATLLFHPLHGAAHAELHPIWRRALMGSAMGLTAIAIIYSPFGQRSGAHMNPAVTFTFWRLGRVATPDACWYALFQCGGALLGVLVARLLLGAAVTHPAVNHVATQPSAADVSAAAVAWLSEFTIAFILMSVVLLVSSDRRLGRFTGLFAGCLVALYIVVESPLSGMSMNPARTLGSAWWADAWRGFWIYVTAPVLAMTAASWIVPQLAPGRPILCAKLHHQNRHRCIFRCGCAERAPTPGTSR